MVAMRAVEFCFAFVFSNARQPARIFKIVRDVVQTFRHGRRLVFEAEIGLVNFAVLTETEGTQQHLFSDETMADFKMRILLFISLLVCGRLLAQPVILTQPTNQVVLNGSNAVFSVGASGLGLLSYQWRFNGTNLSKNLVTTVAGGGNGGDGGAATGASLNYPAGVTADAAGNLFIAEGGNNRVRKVDTNGIISTVAGDGSAAYSGDGGAATNASLNFPVQVTVDGSGNLFIADHDNHRVRKVDTNGVITTVAGNGVADYSGDGGKATNASVHFPSGLVLDGAGNLYLADYWNNRIRKVDVNGIITTVAGNGSTAYSGDGGQATNASLNVPNAMTFDGAGNLLIADYGNSRIRKVDLNGIITTVAGNGQPFAGGDGGAATNASLQDAVYVVTDIFGRLLITDVYDGIIRQVDTNGIITTLVTGLNHPNGLFVDSLDNLFIGDAGSSRIGKVALLGSPVLNLNLVTTNNAGNYAVIISDSSGSVTSSVASLTVNVPVFISTQPQSQSVSVGSNVTFAVTAGGTLPLHYQWLSNSIAILDATNFNFTFNIASTNPVAGFSVVLTNNYGAITSSVAALTVLVIPPGIASPPASQTVGMGSNATFNVVASGSPPFNYLWLFNGAALSAQTNATLNLSGLLTNQSGAYSVLVTSPYGSITSKVATLTVGFPPYLTQQPTNQTILVGGRSAMSVSVAGVGPFSYQWQLNGTNLPYNFISTVAGSGGSGFSGDGGLATAASLSTLAAGVAADAAGNVFIADQNNNRIRKVDVRGIITTVAGTGALGFSGDGGAATNAKLNAPYAVASDAAGNVFIADQSNNRVRRLDTNGIITTVAGKTGAGFAGDGAAATNANLNTPAGLLVDDTGNLFFADQNNHRIRMVGTNGIITTVAGNGTGTFAGDGGPATNASLRNPASVSLDKSGNLVIADRLNNRIRKLDTNGVITTLAGNGSVGFGGDGGLATGAVLAAPYGVLADAAGNVFVADTSNNRIRKVDAAGVISTVAGTGVSGFSGDGVLATAATLSFPRGLALDAGGNLLIADVLNYRIRKIALGSPSLVFPSVSATNAGNYSVIISTPYGSVTSVVATLTVLLPPAVVGQPPNLSAGLGSNATFNVTFTGTLPLAFQWQFNGTNLTNQTAQSLSLTNVQWTNAGSYRVVITNIYGSTTSSLATLTVGLPPTITSQPISQMILSGTNLLLGVAVAGNGTYAYQWRLNGTNLPPVIITVAGNGTNGFSGDGGAATNARMSGAYGVTVDVNGNLFFADAANNRVRKVDTNGIITTIAGTGVSGATGNGGQATNATLRFPEGMTFDKSGNLFFSEFNNADVRKIATNGIITRVAGTTSAGNSADGGQATNTALFNTTAVAVDSIGNLFIADFYSNRIRKVGTNGIITTVAGNGTAGGAGDGGMATNANLGQPAGVALNSAGNLIIADNDNYRVRSVNSSGVISTIAGGGSDLYSNGILGTNANLKPANVAVDPFNNIFIACDNRVRLLDTNGIITTVAGGGSAKPGDFGAATNASLVAQALACDQQGNLYIADRFNFRIRKVCLTGLPTLLLPNASTNHTGNYSVVVTSPYGSVTSSNFSLTVLNLPVIGASPVNVDGTVTLNLSTTPNISSRIYAASNLVPPVAWLPVYTNLNGGIWQFTDTNAPGLPAQFYRVSTP